MVVNQGTPKERALAWWRSRAEAEQYVVAGDELPTGAEGSILRSGGYVLEVGGGVAWIVARPGIDSLDSVFFLNYWRVIQVILARYEPAVVERLAAVRLHSEMTTAPRRLTIVQGANRSRRTIELVPAYEVQIRDGTVDLTHSVVRSPMGVRIYTEPPAATLLGLPVPYLREDPATVALWLKSLVVSRPDLERAYAARPRPVVLKRMGLIAREVGNERLADQIDDVLRESYPQRVGRGHTSRGGALTVPVAVVEMPTTRLPWLDRQAYTFREFAELTQMEVRGAEEVLPRFDIARLIEHARDARAYDAYHSTTMEGYRITPEEVSAILSDRMVGTQDPETVRARMAIAGYSVAFERVLSALRDARGRVRIDEHLIHDLYVDLFSPSVDAGIVAAETLRHWRANPAHLRGHAYVPPAPAKLPRLIQQFQDLVNEIVGRPITRAIMAHLEFVTIHPYVDGNGRLSRFLLNLALVGEGLPWVTIRVEDRRRYFAALERAQTAGDPLPFVRLVREYVKAAASSLAP